MMNRAYSVLQVKEIIERADDYLVKGMASTPATDRMEDVVESLGAVYRLPLPVLWQHRSAEAIGRVISAKTTKAGIPVEISIPKVAEAGRLKERIEEALHSIKYRLVTGLSIGFRALKDGVESIKDGGFRFTNWEWLELSLVTIPANAEATIRTVKSLDTELRAASGQAQDDVELPKPGVTGKAVKLKPDAPKDARTVKKTIAEQISAFEATRAAKAARMEELMTKAGETGATLDAAESEEYDTIEGDVKQVDEHLVRLRALEESNKKAAVTVEKIETTVRASEIRSGVISLKKELPKGTAFTRYVIALARAKGNIMMAQEIAKDPQWGDTPEVANVLKAAVAAGTTTDATWALPLVEYQVMASEFIELLRPQTIIGRLPGLRRVPFNIKMPGQTGGSTVGWVGEGSPKPVSALAFETVTMRWAKIAGIVVLTDELVRFSNPSAEAIVRADLTAAIAQFMDRDFIDPAKAAVANVSPASITNGITAINATGTTAAAFRADVKTLFTSFLAANLSVAGAVWIMTETMALSLSLMQNALGQPEFPGLTMTGGTLLGLPVVTSENIPATGGSPADGGLIILAKTSEIMLADDGGVTIDASREASLQMESAPDSPVATTTTLVSLWQHNMVGLRAERIINWQRRRDEAVGYIAYAKYAA